MPSAEIANFVLSFILLISAIGEKNATELSFEIAFYCTKTKQFCDVALWVVELQLRFKMKKKQRIGIFFNYDATKRFIRSTQSINSHVYDQSSYKFPISNTKLKLNTQFRSHITETGAVVECAYSA